MKNVKFEFTFGSIINVKYKNYKGEISDREIIPRNLWYGSTEFHPEQQFILTAYDFDKHAIRDFALNDFIFDD